MPTVAEQLRAGRDRAKVSISDAAEATKIKSDHILALETGQWKAFSAPVYLRGFVRTYAGYLRLDVAQTMRDLESELEHTRLFPATTSLGPPKRGLVEWGALQLARIKWRIVFPVLLTLGVAAALYLGIRSYREKARRDPLGGLSGGLYETQKPIRSGTVPVPTNFSSGRTR